ncbi:MAG: hypothetical protein HZB59_11270 [Ignavibacteriales bacterium]|nr:hypothetical protein [Ignavibacteriales bacterium]
MYKDLSQWDIQMDRIFEYLLIFYKIFRVQMLSQGRINRFYYPTIIVLLSWLSFLTLSCNSNPQIVSPPLPPQPPTQINTWDFVGLSGIDDISSIVVVPQKPWIIFVGIGSDFSGGTVGKIIKSTDWGGTWKKVTDSISVGKIILDPQNENILYASLGPLNDCIPGVIKSTDMGDSWFRIDKMMDLDWEMGAGITIDPTNSNVLYTSISGYFGGGLLKSVDAGNTWFMLPPKWEGSFPPLADGVTAFAIDPKNSNELYLGMNWTGYLMKSYNGGDTFNVIRDSALGLPVCLLVNPYRTNVVYLGCVEGGFQRSTDHGISWHWMGFINAYKFIMYKDSMLFLCDNGGVHISTNDGVNWRRIGIGTAIDQVLALGIDKRNKFLYAANNSLSSSAGLYRYKINN